MKDKAKIATHPLLNGKVRLLSFEKDELQFQYFQDNELQKEIRLPAGYGLVADKFFHQPIPTDAETDYAINYIEDELMSNSELTQNNEVLLTADENLIELFRKNELNENVYTRQAVEDLFSSYARVIMGAPTFYLKAEITATDFAILLVLREIMHHLNFDSINLLH